MGKKTKPQESVVRAAVFAFASWIGRRWRERQLRAQAKERSRRIKAVPPPPKKGEAQ
jgi:hypothetical protein